VPIPKRKHEPASDIDTEVVVSPKALDTERPNREGDIEQPLLNNLDFISTSKLFVPSGQRCTMTQFGFLLGAAPCRSTI
jgi:hypothetical protein